MLILSIRKIKFPVKWNIDNRSPYIPRCFPKEIFMKCPRLQKFKKTSRIYIYIYIYIYTIVFSCGPCDHVILVIQDTANDLWKSTFKLEHSMSVHALYGRDRDQVN